MNFFSLDMNKELWADKELFNEYFKIVLLLNKAVKDEKWEPLIFLDLANRLDSVMQKYEQKYDRILDPIFYWSFATANALFLLIGKKYDELGDTRISYIINGYQEGLYLHQTYPSYPRIYIDKAFEHMSPFAKGEDANWIKINRSNFIPIKEQFS
ncbi:MAG: hypothetical protein COW71_13570 [Ignavibacteriales bacterium CG18_big_fil_WC_8_21_14_2_50_31_20]|nr:MAG: hypothetical protein COW71_13570 [Ignavibacteriales bacterium CG18_big_fil_WC_8_21_14_2_50_31_20]